ncbi:pyridoxal phosphate-dependent aminotransferase [Halorientalis halophila]|uniref:pyridoxal phosphate-dependent aminotransferase n=1 Tax=Halorientalis halophila TaxID=3108499 RepID=UPI0030091AE4
MDYERPQFFRVMQYADAASGDVVDMVSGNPDWEPPEALRDGLAEYAEAEPDRFQYPASEGLRALREEIAARRGVDVRQVLVTNGAGEANHLAWAAALARDAGDEVLLTDPVYPYYAGRTNLLGGTPRYVDVEEDGRLDPDAVRAAASDDTALIAVNTPNNPTGAIYPEDALRELVDVAETYDALLVSDEVYDHFDYEEAFASALAIDSDRRIVTNSFSKSLAITGFRVGYTVVPGPLVDGFRTRHMLTNVTTSRPAQYAVLRALRETPPDYFARNRDLLRSRIAAFTDALDEAGAAYTTPEGSFYVMARFEGFPGTMANVERLIDEAGVAGMPGAAFGESRTDWFRFALVTPRVETAAERLADYFD